MSGLKITGNPDLDYYNFCKLLNMPVPWVISRVYHPAVIPDVLVKHTVGLWMVRNVDDAVKYICNGITGYRHVLIAKPAYINSSNAKWQSTI